MSLSPIDQFKVKSIGNNILISDWNISFSNSALAMSITLILIGVFFYLGIKKSSIIPHKLQMLNELTYDFVYSISKENIHSEKLHKIFPFIFSLFMFLLFGNFVGLLPGSFAFTSQLIITGGLAVFILVVATITGIYLHGIKFLKILMPSGLPLALAPFMIVLEFISYFTKALSMGIRIFANIMAGHIILEIFAGFVIALGIFGIIPLSFTVILYAFEFGIAFIQAYIFTILTCIFLDQVINLH
jgi:F-type H+-transporting ATPase subunit a